MEIGESLTLAIMVVNLHQRYLTLRYIISSWLMTSLYLNLHIFQVVIYTYSLELFAKVITS